MQKDSQISRYVLLQDCTTMYVLHSRYSTAGIAIARCRYMVQKEFAFPSPPQQAFPCSFGFFACQQMGLSWTVDSGTESFSPSLQVSVTSYVHPPVAVAVVIVDDVNDSLFWCCLIMEGVRLVGRCRVRKRFTVYL